VTKLFFRDPKDYPSIESELTEEEYVELVETGGL
jgi:hypothetical protein